MPLIPALGRARQADLYEFVASLVYVKPHLKGERERKTLLWGVLERRDDPQHKRTEECWECKERRKVTLEGTSKEWEDRPQTQCPLNQAPRWWHSGDSQGASVTQGYISLCPGPCHSMPCTQQALNKGREAECPRPAQPPLHPNAPGPHLPVTSLCSSLLLNESGLCCFPLASPVQPQENRTLAPGLCSANV